MTARRSGSSRASSAANDCDGAAVMTMTGSPSASPTQVSSVAGPATEETWVGDAEGDPVMVITAAPSQSLAAELARLLPDLRAVIGPDRRCTLVFDRGGYSPQVFTQI